jgi:hypothetical protein
MVILIRQIPTLVLSAVKPIADQVVGQSDAVKHDELSGTADAPAGRGLQAALFKVLVRRIDRKHWGC